MTSCNATRNVYSDDRRVLLNLLWSRIILSNIRELLKMGAAARIESFRAVLAAMPDETDSQLKRYSTASSSASTDSDVLAFPAVSTHGLATDVASREQRDLDR